MTPATLALFVGLATSSGLGYAPVGPTVDLRVRSHGLELRSSVDATPKASTGRGWNVRQDVLVGGRVMAGFAYQAWSGGPWTKQCVSGLVRLELTQGVHVVGRRSLTSSYGESHTSVGLEMDAGRMRASLGVVRFTQTMGPRYGVTADVAWRVR